MRLMFAAMLALLLATGCKTQPEAQPEARDDAAPVSPTSDFDMRVTKIRYFSTNPSIPPQFQSEDEWILLPEHVDDWDKLMANALDKTTVNGEMTLREHAAALASNDKGMLKKLELPDGVARVEPSGAPDVTFVMFDGEAEVYRFRSDLEYSGSGYSELVSTVKKKGDFTEKLLNPPAIQKSEPDAD